jgi:hypothetical protein
MDFDNWFYEQEGFGFRVERFWSDYDARNQLAMLEWLRTAYQMGYEEGKKLYGGTE